MSGLAFGDEGKGTVTDYLVRRSGARTVVRWNGGPQCGHNVVTPEGRHHCFAQLGAGSFVPGTRTVLTSGMVVELENLAREAGVLEEKGVDAPLCAVTLDPDCAVVTPMHKLVGQLAELARGADRKGSCGMGVGEAFADRARGGGLTVRDLVEGRGLARLEALARDRLRQAEELARRVPAAEVARLRERFRERCRPRLLHERYCGLLGGSGLLLEGSDAALRAALARGPVVFEGAQGALLDREGGFQPHVTQTRTTPEAALALLDRVGCPGRRLGVLRAYAHRHGAGPLVTEDPGLSAVLEEPHNPTNPWQGAFRVGALDLVALRYGLALHGGVDALVVTGLDRLAALEHVDVCTSYLYEGDLGCLGPALRWEALGERRARLVGIMPVGEAAPEQRRLLTQVLLRCRPLDVLRLPSPSCGSSDVAAGALAEGARRLLDLLEGPDGLGVPVAVASCGPRADQKLLLRADAVGLEAGALAS